MAAADEPESSQRRQALSILGGSVASWLLQSTAAGAQEAPAAPEEAAPAASAPASAPSTKVYKGSGADAKLRKGFGLESSTRFRVKDTSGKTIEAPDVTFPTSVDELKKEYVVTKAGTYFKVIEEGEGPTPKKGDVIELHYIGTVCDADKDGSYDPSEPEGAPEIYPSMPQGILKDSPRFDSSYARGRTMKVRFGKAQLMLGLEEALLDMKPGGSKMVFLTPEVGFACPPGKMCVSDLEVNERFAMFIKLVSIGEKQDVGG